MRRALWTLLLAACSAGSPHDRTTAAAVALGDTGLTWVHELAGPEGVSVRGALVELDGRLFGLAGEWGPNGTPDCNSSANWPTVEHAMHCPGALFSLGPDGLRVEHAFAQLDDAYRNADGYHPYGSLAAANGWLYGVTQMGGTPQISGLRGAGVLFRYRPAGATWEILHHFPSQQWAFDGAYPMGTVAPLPDGRVCGTTKAGSRYSTGAVWCWSEAGLAYEPIPAAVGGAVGGVTFAHGKLHGVTSWGGTSGKGTYFTADPDTLAIAVVDSFPDYGKPRCCDDNTPIASPLLVSDGTLLIAREFGGPAGTGVIAKLDDTGIHVLRELDDVAPNVAGPAIRFSNATGAMPNGQLTEGCDGLIYGTSLYGGAGGAGSIYQFARDGTRFRLLYSFPLGGPSYPYGGLTRGSDCALYGTTFVRGQVFRFRPPGNACP
jgi:uncharacterized repeat protein (TIGR03803 family)